jgi:NAD-dependent SIR2 family protein deacetylase/cytochrome c-type biogenesis protein CcmH/NrfG
LADRVKIKEVANHIRKEGKASFVIGAGASISAGIPSANGLIKLIEQEFPHIYNKLNETDRKSYGRVMSQLFQADIEKLIVPLLTKARMNWGHIALATLLRGEHVNRVLTFNFDLLLERAASMLGVHLPVYDFGTSHTDEVTRLVSPSIIHLHGQSHGMVLLNSDKETRNHAEKLRPVLADTLRNDLTVVIGYSGEADAAFDIFQTEYKSRKRLLWLGHAPSPPPHIQALLDSTRAEYIGDCDFDRVMIDLAKDLGDWPPMILKNPMDHVTEVLEPTTDFPVGEQGDQDFLPEIRSRLADFSVRWESEATPNSRAYDAGLGIVDDSRKDGANGDMGKDEQPLSEGAKLALAWSLIDQGNALANEAHMLTGDAARAKFVEAGAKYAEAVQIKPDKHEAFYNWGTALDGEARTLTGAAARAKFVEAGANYAEAVRIKPDKHEAFNNWGSALAGEAGTLTGDAARVKFAEAGAKYAEAVRIKPDYHEAFDNWGGTLLRLSDVQDGDDREALLTLAMEYLTKAATISGKAVYNLACLLALRGEAEKAVAQLQACQRDGTLPDAAHLDADADLDGIRQAPAYLAFRAGLT